MAAPPIDCRAYYISSDASLNGHGTGTSKSSEFCRNSDRNGGGDAGSGFSVSKYLIDRSETGIVGKVGREPTDPRPVRADNVVCSVDNVAGNGAMKTVATGSDVRTSGHARQRPVRGRFRRTVCRLESLLAEMKVTNNNNNNNNNNSHVFVPWDRGGGTWHHQAGTLVEEIGRRTANITGDARESNFLFRQLPVTLQRGNAVSFQNTFTAS